MLQLRKTGQVNACCVQGHWGEESTTVFKNKAFSGRWHLRSEKHPLGSTVVYKAEPPASRTFHSFIRGHNQPSQRSRVQIKTVFTSSSADIWLQKKCLHNQFNWPLNCFFCQIWQQAFFSKQREVVPVIFLCGGDASQWRFLRVHASICGRIVH